MHVSRRIAYPAPRCRLSDKLTAAIRLHSDRAYRIAQGCDLHPSTLSKWINGIERPRPGDPRVLRLAAFVGIPAGEAIEKE